MSDEVIKVDMSRHQRPYTRGPQTRKNLEAEFAREFPGETVSGTGEEMYNIMEQKLHERAAQRKAARDAQGTQ
jgi:hypothetical protein